MTRAILASIATANVMIAVMLIRRKLYADAALNVVAAIVCMAFVVGQ